MLFSYFLFFLDKFLKLVGGGSVINRAFPSSFNKIGRWFGTTPYVMVIVLNSPDPLHTKDMAKKNLPILNILK